MTVKAPCVYRGDDRLLFGIFTALSASDDSAQWLSGVITFAGRQDNIAIRQAALIALGFNREYAPTSLGSR